MVLPVVKAQLSGPAGEMAISIEMEEELEEGGRGRRVFVSSNVYYADRAADETGYRQQSVAEVSAAVMDDRAWT